MRVASGVIIGYLVFAGSAVLLFRVTHQNPHASASTTFELAAVVYGILFALLGGYIASLIGGRDDAMASKLMAILLAAVAVVSMIAAHVVAWSQVAALAFMTPSTLIGGRIYVTRRRANTKNGH